MSKESQKTLSRWNDRVHTALKYRDSIAERDQWQTYINEFKGIYDIVLGKMYVPPINEVYAYCQSTKANLFDQNPYIAVNAKKTGTIEGSYIWEALLNHDWAEMKIKDEVDLEIDDTILVGHSWNKVGNNVKTSGSGDQLAIESEKLYSNRVSWRDMVFNIGTKRILVDTLWTAQRIWRPTDDVKKDYGAAAKNLVGNPLPEVNDKIRKSMLYKDDINFSALWEIWDAQERKVYLMADESSGDFLQDPRPWPSYLDEFPYQNLSFCDIPDEAYPMSDIAPWNPQILEKIKVFTMMLNHVKRWNRQMIMKKNTLKDQDKDKFEKGLDGSILDAAVSGNQDIQSAFKMLDFGSLPPDIYMALDRLDGVKRSVNGQPEFQQGGITKTSSRTQGELELIGSGADRRTNVKQYRIERHCANIARQLMAHRKNNLELDMVVRVTGKEPPEILKAFENQGIYDPATKTIKFSKENIQGEYDVSIKPGSTLPLDKMTRDKILNKVYELSIPLASAPSVPPFIAEILKELLRDYGIKSLERAFDEQQASIAQKDQGSAMEQEAQMAKTESETSKRQAQAQQINAETIIKTANALGKSSGDIAPDMSITK